MDPWKTNISDININKDNSEFEDNFQPSEKIEYCPLPDSKEYLEILERKLTKLKSDANILQQLKEKHDDYMNQLLSDNLSLQENDENLMYDQPINDSYLVRTVCPERQALTIGEQAKLTDHDQLQKNFELEHEIDNNSDNISN